MFLVGLVTAPAVIAPGASLSGPVSLGAMTIGGISMPAVWTTANLTFQVSPDGGTTWQELYDDRGNEVTIQVAAGQFILMLALPTYDWRAVNMVQVRSGTAALPVVQAVGATINLIAKNEQL